MIEAIYLSKKYGHDYALNNISFNTAQGNTLGVYGRHGAGKTTLADILSGCVYPSSGSVIISGIDLEKHSVTVKRNIGYMPEHSQPYNDMTVLDFIIFSSALKHVPYKKRRAYALAAMEAAGTQKLSGSLLGSLSRSDEKRVYLAAALSSKPKLLILDEPCSGLFPEETARMRETIKSLRGEYTIILMSSSVSVIADLCDNVLILNAGESAAFEDLSAMRSGLSGKKRLCLKFASDKQSAMRLLRTVPEVESVQYKGCGEEGACDFIAESSGTDTREAIFRAAAAAGMPLLGMSSLSVTLEDLFAQLSGGDEASQ